MTRASHLPNIKVDPMIDRIPFLPSCLILFLVTVAAGDEPASFKVHVLAPSSLLNNYADQPARPQGDPEL